MNCTWGRLKIEPPCEIHSNKVSILVGPLSMLQHLSMLHDNSHHTWAMKQGFLDTTFLNTGRDSNTSIVISPVLMKHVVPGFLGGANTCSNDTLGEGDELWCPLLAAVSGFVPRKLLEGSPQGTYCIWKVLETSNLEDSTLLLVIPREWSIFGCFRTLNNKFLTVGNGERAGNFLFVHLLSVASDPTEELILMCFKIEAAPKVYLCFLPNTRHLQGDFLGHVHLGRHFFLSTKQQPLFTWKKYQRHCWIREWELRIGGVFLHPCRE